MDCIFCKIAKGEIPSKKVYEDSGNMAFLDINPRNPGHTLVIPKTHNQDIFSISEEEAADLMKAISRVARGVQNATGAKGLTITQNNGQLAGQVVPHIHFHLIPRTEAEKGVALEGVLPVKNQAQASLDSMAKKIAHAIPKPPAEKKPEPVVAKPKQESVSSNEPDVKGPDGQEINFDF